MTRRTRRYLLLLLVIGTAAKLVIAFTTFGQAYDLRVWEQTARSLVGDPLHVYSLTNPPDLYRWPYPPGLFPWLLIAFRTARLTGIPFHAVFQIPAVLADVGIALLVQELLRRAGAAERTRIFATALVAVGPVFVAISGHHGQFDSVAILFGLAAYAIWAGSNSPRRALAAGTLLGVGGAIKLVPLLLLLVMLPKCRSWLERVCLTAPAAAVPGLLLAPFFVADATGVVRMLRYGGGLPGMGGLSLALQPDLARFWLLGIDSVPSLNGFTRLILGHGAFFNSPIPLLAAAFLLRWRLSPIRSIVFLWLAIYALGTSFFFQYLIWGIPFFLAAGYLRETAILQGSLIVPMYLFYTAPHNDPSVVPPYVVIMLVVWAMLVVAFVRLGSNAVRGGRANAALSP